MPNYVDQEKKSVIGVVTESLPNTLFRVVVEDIKKETLAYLSGKIRLHRIKILIGDKVELEIDKYGGKARIIKRL